MADVATAVDGPGQQGIAEAERFARRHRFGHPCDEPAVVRHEEPHECRHIGAGRGQATVGGTGLQPGRRGQRLALGPGPVVVGGFVADGKPIAHRVRDRRLGAAHPELGQHAPPDDLAVRLVLDRLEDQPERLVAHVRVVEPATRRRPGRQVAQPPDLGRRLRRAVDPGGDPGGVAEEVVDRDRVAMARDAEPGQVSDDGVIGRQPPFPCELQDGDRGERLADRSDLEQRVAGDRQAGRDVAQAGHAAGQQTVTIGHREGEARYRAVGAVLDDDVVQGAVERGVSGSEGHGPPMMPARPPEHRAKAVRCGPVRTNGVRGGTIDRVPLRPIPMLASGRLPGV